METSIEVPAGSPALGAGDGLLARIRTKLKSIAGRIASLFKKKPLALPPPTADANATPQPPAQTQNPPAQTPPTQTPPAQTPPAQTPPAQVSNAPTQAQNPPAQVPPGQKPPEVQTPPTQPPEPTKTPQEQLAEAITAKDAAKVDQLATTPELRAQVLDKVQTDVPFVEKLVAQNRAHWVRPALALAFKLSNGGLIKRIATDVASKTEAIKEAIAQSRAGMLLTAVGISGEAEWHSATDAASYSSLIGGLPGPIRLKEINAGVWLLYGDGTDRDASLTFSKLYAASIVPAGSDGGYVDGDPFMDGTTQYQNRFVYDAQAPNADTMKVFLTTIKSIPPSHVDQSKIVFSSGWTKIWRKLSPPPVTPFKAYTPGTSGITGVIDTSYYLASSKTIVMYTVGGAIASRPVGTMSDGAPEAVGGTAETAPDGLLSVFQNHARHEIGHAVGAKVFKGMAKSGDEFALEYGDWQPSSSAGIIGAYWTMHGTQQIDWKPGGAPKGAPKEVILDADVAEYLVGLIEGGGTEPPKNAITDLDGTVDQKLDLLKPKYSGQPLWQYFEKIGGRTSPTTMKLNGYMFPGFAPPGDRVHIWLDRSETKGFYSYSAAVFAALHTSHGWYSVASHKEMFAEMYAKKYSGGAPVPGAAAAFFKGLESSPDTDTLSSIVPPAAPKPGDANAANPANTANAPVQQPKTSPPPPQPQKLK
jgi:hypothetical protein